MSRKTIAMIANANASQEKSVEVGDGDIPKHYQKKPSVKKPAKKAKAKAKAKKRA